MLFRSRAQFPVGSIHRKVPGGGNATPADEEYCETFAVDLQESEESLEPFVGGVGFGIGGKEGGKLLEIDASCREQSEESGGEAFPPGFVDSEGKESVLEEFDRMGVGHRFGRDLCLATCRIMPKRCLSA